MVILAAVVRGEASEPDQSDSGMSTGSPAEGGGSDESRAGPPDIRDVSFPVSLRGYDRRTVDAYVARSNGLIAELETSRSPETAVRHALEQLGEQTSGILEQAGETAETIAVSARQKAEELTASAKRAAEETVAQAKGEAEETVAKAKSEADAILDRSKAEAKTTLDQARKEAAEERQRAQEEVTALREEAEGRLRELHADTDAIRAERRDLLDDLREITARVEETAAEADVRFPPRDASETAEEGMPETEPEAETQVNSAAAAEPHNGTAGREVRPGR
jgi:DivIVA domain-containing protein